MIVVTQGYEQSIGVEIFLKSYILLPSHIQNKIIFICDHSTLADQLEKIQLPFKLNGAQNLLTLGNTQLQCSFCAHNPELPITTRSLIAGLDLIQKQPIQRKNILITLPTAKNQIIDQNAIHKGYTEFFRHYYKNEEISMIFRGPHTNLLLITDHLPLHDTCHKISQQLIVQKVALVLKTYPQYFDKLDRVVLSGINPHAGEKGLLGTEDQCIASAVSELRSLFPRIVFEGPYSADVLTFYQKHPTIPQSKTLLVYMNHDQGLSYFKSRFGFLGINITLGLPFLRVSVDHGTAEDLYGKDCANYSGMNYLFQECIKI